jgi:hypothetical protein
LQKGLWLVPGKRLRRWKRFDLKRATGLQKVLWQVHELVAMGGLEPPTPAL